jgi:transposase-like protein|tara:strand:- start:76 stop:1347 length:1272 start_codon:yes stop_codon:yes gene_type:complete
MSKLSARKKRVKRTVSIGKVAPEAVGQVEDLDGRIEAIQWLIPLGLKAVTEELQRAVVELAGPRYERKGSDQPLRRWGSQPGSVYLGDQKLPVDVPRVRNVGSDTEVPLRAYQALQTPRQIDEGLLLRMLKGIATRNYEACAETVPEAFGLSRSSVSRRYVKGTARKLAEFQERCLEGYDLVALFLDGKSFADEEIIIALGVTLDGQKIPLGFVQAATENERVCRRFLSDLVERGLQYEAGLLVVIDGGKGLYKSVMSVIKGHACVQRCQYHKRQNVVSYLPKSEQVRIRRKMEAAYGKPTYAAAKAALDALKPGLKLMNQSALGSLEEGFEETLTLHRLGLMPMLKDSFRTTNCIENVNSLLAQLTHNVRRWTNSSQRHRWVATALLDIEPRLRRVRGFHHLPMLRQAIQAELGIKQLAMTG